MTFFVNPGGEVFKAMGSLLVAFVCSAPFAYYSPGGGNWQLRAIGSLFGVYLLLSIFI